MRLFVGHRACIMTMHRRSCAVRHRAAKTGGIVLALFRRARPSMESNGGAQACAPPEPPTLSPPLARPTVLASAAAAALTIRRRAWKRADELF
ncbi:hypothetical protein WS70_15885 [Burkholderia mayonis]|uniref:Uncharacterized protein n=1 Tax=Burkholderia mayonis TaxID=1385591 RepID=A0A1B4FHK0_9BURK|nr:hypothetical protein WS70_15885 [Burkholderia mayonis]KVE39045.1 hypothetical protein WS69_01490 [Burkholderia sp. BDU5]KVE48255.1 hypothetical protein WS70_24260 [Burkholderia mayonis]